LQKLLQSITGFLNFCNRAIVPGRAFTRRLINLSMGLSRSFQHVRINKEARADARAWLLFLNQFNGSCMFLHDLWLSSEALHLGTDASGKYYAAVYGSKWFMGVWPSSWSDKHITVKELFPIVLATQVWAHLWRNHKVLFFTDNMAVVDIINSQTCKDPFTMTFVRRLVTTTLLNNILFRAKHVPGKQNQLCDLLSRALVQETREIGIQTPKQLRTLSIYFRQS